jgi:hypothetical protein
MTVLEETIDLLVKLTGQPIPFTANIQKLEAHDLFEGGIGYSQLNELLLTLGYDRVTQGFFNLLSGKAEEIASFENLKQGVNEFRKKAMFLYGNIKYAFKRLSRLDDAAITKELNPLQPEDEEHYTKRHLPLHHIENIPPEKAHYLGYIIRREIKDSLEKNPGDPELQTEWQKLNHYCELGKKNHESYLVSDHMDVYIATSMRERYEFLVVGEFVEQLFQKEPVKDLKLRYFNPIQAYCEDRIDKGLVEGLMLKRARCTIYHVQESDTLGKDSELAATLAQGKPVIAYLPKVSDFQTFSDDTKRQIQKRYPEQLTKGLLKRLQRYYPEGAWERQDIRDWLEDESKVDPDGVMKLLHEKVTAMYDNRARTLCEIHPLSLQVNLSSGVTNGVLVVRSIQDCAQLLRSILLRTMEFDIEDKDGSVLLKERISKCVYRAVTKDDILTNAFWNFYLRS